MHGYGNVMDVSVWFPLCTLCLFQSAKARYQVGHAIMPIISIGRTASTIFYCSFFITTKHHISVLESKNVYACNSELLQKYAVCNHKWLQNFQSYWKVPELKQNRFVGNQKYSHAKQNLEYINSIFRSFPGRFLWFGNKRADHWFLTGLYSTSSHYKQIQDFLVYNKI